MLVAYLAQDMLRAGVPYWVVLPVCVVCGALLGGVLELLIARPMRHRAHISVAMATLGAMLALEGAAGWQYGFTPSSLTPAFADAGTLRVGELAVSANRIFILGISLAATGSILFLLQRTRLGLAAAYLLFIGRMVVVRRFPSVRMLFVIGHRRALPRAAMRRGSPPIGQYPIPAIPRRWC